MDWSRIATVDCLTASPARGEARDAADLIIVGAGPAGISASLRAIERKLTYVTLERDAVGGSVAKYPRQKLVMTSPVEFPLAGSFKKTQLSKENLLAFWKTICDREDFRVTRTRRSRRSRKTVTVCSR